VSRHPLIITQRKGPPLRRRARASSLGRTKKQREDGCSRRRKLPFGLLWKDEVDRDLGHNLDLLAVEKIGFVFPLADGIHRR
jgi:hypothetical protein